jgi:hypothetical protein
MSYIRYIIPIDTPQKEFYHRPHSRLVVTCILGSHPNPFQQAGVATFKT